MKSRIVNVVLLATGLLLFPNASQGRWMNPGSGRFMTMDTYEGRNQDPLNLHKYVYCEDNPINKIDPSGKWPTHVLHVHQDAIRYELAFLPNTDLDTLTSQQMIMDDLQSSSMSYLHAMRGPGEKRDDAWRKANQWIHSELTYAQSLDDRGDRTGAMVHLSNAIHTLQDSTSPAHKGFQLWDDRWAKTSDEVLDHVFEELYNPGPGSGLYKITLSAYDHFVSPKPLPIVFIPRPTGAEVDAGRIRFSQSFLNAVEAVGPLF